MAMCMLPINSANLLTGEVVLLDSIPQPRTGTVDHQGGDFLDDAMTQPVADAHNDSKTISSQVPSDSGSQLYITSFKLLAGPHWQERRLDFMEAKKLELERFRLNLSAAERDRALLSIGIDPVSINPNMLLDYSYMGRLYRVANTLALLGQAFVEDKIIASIGLETVDESSVDFWNVTAIDERCAGGACQVRAESGQAIGSSLTSSSSTASESLFTCSKCGRKVCKICSAGKGALLFGTCISKEIANYNGVTNQGGSVNGYSADASPNRLATLDVIFCKLCCNEVVLDVFILDYVRVLISRKRNGEDDAAEKALKHVIGLSARNFFNERDQLPFSQGNDEIFEKLTNGEESLAEFPFASFLHPVETAVGSAPLLL